MDHTARNTAATNRTRYALLCDRRRALFELHKLAEAVRAHPNYATAARTVAGLEGMVAEQLEATSCNLCRAGKADPEALQRDVCRLYGGLSSLAKVWVYLEDGRDLEPLVQAHYDALFAGDA
ncbi:hypothetical protein [Truepera radiovictrix]|uniref:Uncharacterized protein n=1 Tax=Truepera radiovictrix (strain DSM 17093 / CIP 108686 / LMG 22925 / RQ-24) TaxID=649638 RepID=D7CRK0_TRURR|nr:hypothetical protein [Truepera radiovictrix]ADI13490.1 hypothetical protein Trad_0351 [Truepera radiovictrix DSM 17093]WMT57948.1 hypothetical protein RCV51_03115 [Truepera radiovictrix]